MATRQIRQVVRRVVLAAGSAMALFGPAAARALVPQAAVDQAADAAVRAIGAVVVGQVRDAATGAPLAGAAVDIEGLPLRVVTDTTGRYRFASVPPGPQVLRVRRLGYAPARVPLTVPSSGELTRDVTLAQSALRMREVTVTADAAGRARGELGTASVIDRDAIATQAAASLAGLLEQVPGTPLSPPGLEGVQQAALRSVPASPGSGGLGAVTGPGPDELAAFGTLIVVDGVPLSNNANLQTTGPRAEMAIPTSAGGGVDLRRIPAATLERVEVVRGVPSARYGDLTQGAIVVETRAGAFRPEAMLRYDARTLELSASGGRTFGTRHTGAAVLDVAHTTVSPGIRDDDVFRIAGQLSHRAALRAAPRGEPGVVGGAEPTITLDSRLEFHQLHANNPERPDVQPGYANWSRDFGLRVQERLRVGAAAGRRLDVTGALSFTRQRSYAQQLHIRGAQPFTDRLDEGRSIGRFVAGEYLGAVRVEGSPWLAYGRAEGTLPARLFGADHRFVAGTELRREWNRGPGYQFDIERPPQSSFNGVRGFDRPRTYDDVPAIATSGWYVDDRVVLPLPWGMSADAQLGARLDLFHEGGSWFSAARDALLQPRANLQLAPRPWVRLRAGAGRTAKLPSLAMIAPAPEYYDVVNVNWYVPEPDERLAVLTTFIEDPTNPELGFSTGRKAEAGIEIDLGRSGATLAVVRFADGIDGGVGYFPRTGFVTREHYALDDSTGATGRPPGIVEPPQAVDTVPIVSAVPTNDLRLRARGTELTALFPAIPGLRTRVQLQGAWVRSDMRTSAPDFGAPNRFADFQLDSARRRIPYWEGVERTGRRALLTTRLVHHQPSLGLVITATVQHTLEDEQRDVAAMDTLSFAGYLTRQGELVQVARGDRTAPEYADLRVTRTGLLSIPRGAPSDWIANLQVSKALGRDGRLTFYAFNVLDRVGQYARTGIGSRLYPPLRFGMEFSIPFGEAR